LQIVFRGINRIQSNMISESASKAIEIQSCYIKACVCEEAKRIHRKTKEQLS